jgi:DNA-binding PadR family transcriptional regulator
MSENELTDAELVILSLICEGPQHGYQIEQQITFRNMRAWTDLSTSSIYYILGKLEGKGFIKQVKDQRKEESERYRKVYQLTPEGGSAWKKATLEALSRPKFTYTNFLLGLHNLWNIPPGEALDAVQTYRNWLISDLQRQRDELADIGISMFPLDVLFEYGFVLGDAEIKFLDDLIARLKDLAEESQPASNNNKEDNEEDK